MWTYLFPEDAAFELIDSSARSLSRTNGGSGPKVFVGKQRSLLDAEIPSAFGLVVLDPSRDIVGRLGSRGFAYVREFAGVPQLRDARFLMPLDGGRAAAGVFELYAPYRPLARAKLAVARSVATLGVPLWGRERICVALREVPPLEATLREMFGGSWFRIGFSAGTPGGFPKPAFVAIDRAGRPLAFGKIADNPLRRHAIAREAGALSQLASRNLSPELLFAGEIGGRLVTLQRPLDGVPGPRRLSEPHRRYLASLISSDRRPAVTCEFVRTLEERIAARPGPPREAVIFSRLRPMLQEQVLPVAVIHGDFAPWNLRRRGEQMAAFDWEWWSGDGLPLIDEIHHTLQVGFLLEGWGVDRADAYLRSVATSLPLGLTEKQVYLVEALGLLDYYLRILEDGYSESGNPARPYGAVLARILTRLGQDFPHVGSDELLA